MEPESQNPDFGRVPFRWVSNRPTELESVGIPARYGAVIVGTGRSLYNGFR